ncbi:MAG TPA: hypothetical protein O0W90_03020 [Methanocorpusculum sp.]|nr:hypothetical protein [Methanocorpusculum sp.]
MAGNILVFGKNSQIGSEFISRYTDEVISTTRNKNQMTNNTVTYLEDYSVIK